MSMELSNYLESWVVTYLGDLQPTYIGVMNNASLGGDFKYFLMFLPI